MTHDMRRFLEKFGYAELGIAAVAIVTAATLNLYEATFVLCAGSATVLLVGLFCELLAWRLRLRKKRARCLLYG